MIEWKRIPWPLWVYAALALWPLVVIEVVAHGPIAVKLLYPAVMLAWLYFLLKGVRWIWFVAIAINVLGFLPEVISGSLTWQGAILGLLSLTLLLLPVTRRYFLGRTAAAGV